MPEPNDLRAADGVDAVNAPETSPTVVEVLCFEDLPFNTGVEQPPDGSAELPVGRFSTGIERAPETLSALRVGSFADGCHQIPRR